jgi:hypothetical protein
MHERTSTRDDGGVVGDAGGDGGGDGSGDGDGNSDGSFVRKRYQEGRGGWETQNGKVCNIGLVPKRTKQLSRVFSVTTALEKVS